MGIFKHKITSMCEEQVNDRPDLLFTANFNMHAITAFQSVALNDEV